MSSYSNQITTLLLDSSFMPYTFLTGRATFLHLIKNNMILSYHDRSDGGLITTLLECSFAGHVGIDIDFKKDIVFQGGKFLQ